MMPNVFTAVLWLMAAMAMALAVYLWFRRELPARRILALLSASIGIWCFGYGNELACTELEQMHFWINVQYPGIVAVPPLWLLFCLRYTRSSWLKSPKSLAALAVVPLIVLLAVWTNDWHHLYYARTAVVQQWGLHLQLLEPGPLYLLYVLFAWSCVLYGTLELVRLLRAVPTPLKANVIFLILAGLIPFLMAVIRAFSGSLGGVVDITPGGFPVSFILVLYALTRRQFGILRPIARDVVLNNLDEGLMVFDESGILIDINKAARDILWEQADPGYPAATILANVPDILRAAEANDAAAFQTEVRCSEGSKVLDVVVMPLHDDQERKVGTTILLRDVTRASQDARAAERHRRYLEAQAMAAAALVASEDLDAGVNEALRIIGEAVDVDRVYIFENDTEPSGEVVLSQIYEWAREGVTAQLPSPQLQRLPYKPDYERWYNLLSVGKPVQGLVEDFPEAEQPLLKEQDIQSLLVLPVMIGGDFWGFISFDECHERRVWSPAEVAVLSTLAAVIGGTIARMRAARKERLLEQRFRSYFELPITGIVVADPERRITEANPAFCDLLGYSLEELIGRDWAELTDPEDMREEPERYSKAMQQGLLTPIYEKRYLRKDGSAVPVLVAPRIVRDEGGAPQYVIAVVVDISRQKETEAQLRALNERLQEMVNEKTLALSNALTELLTFEDTVSSELNASLVTTREFAKLLEETARDRLTDAERRYLSNILQTTEELQDRLAGMMRLNAVGRSELIPIQTDITYLAKRITRDLSAADPSRNVGFWIQEGLTATGDPRELEIALLELLTNAWKFTSRRERAVIEVGMEQTPHGQAFFVRDNGVGFPPISATRLFRIFTRVGVAPELEGQGVGLAVVHRIVQRHNGRVWAVGEEGKGCTIYFTLGLSDRQTP